ncbi:MAG: type I restriction endonuclease [Candidatus Omnitrophota bacterium]|nr:type I restriction endonuclease [Candidatus Omnitrophota bacterium]
MKRYWVIAPYNSEKKEIFDKAWEFDLKNGTIAVGWKDMKDIFMRPITEVEYNKIYDDFYSKKLKRISVYDRKTFWRFWHDISIGDLVIARRGMKRMLAFGEVIGGPFYDENKGKERVGYLTDYSYANFLSLKWQINEIAFEKQVFLMSTIQEIPEDRYNLFIRGESKSVRTQDKVINKLDDHPLEVISERPQWLESLINDIESLKNDPQHKERAHESLVEAFYELLGFKKFNDIKHRQGRIDISIEIQGKTIIVNEVKKDWNQSYRDKTTIIQAYNYSLESGARFVVITNGDYYAIFDKDKGRSYDANFLGDFQLSKLEKNDLGLIDLLRKDSISKPL